MGCCLVFTTRALKAGEFDQVLYACIKITEFGLKSFVDTTNPALHRLLPRPTLLVHSLPQNQSPHSVFLSLRHKLENDKVSLSEDTELSLLLRATGATWSRAARRQRQRDEMFDSKKKMAEPQEVVLVCRLEIFVPAKEGVLQLSWLYGSDRQLFESLWSHILRHINAS